MIRILFSVAAVGVVVVGWCRGVPAARTFGQRCIAGIHRHSIYVACSQYDQRSDESEFEGWARPRSPTWPQQIPPAQRLLSLLDDYNEVAAGATRCRPGIHQILPHEIIPIFLHGRRAPASEERLVAVAIDATAFSNGDPTPIRVAVLSPTGPLTSYVRRSQDERLEFAHTRDERLRLFFGRSDPADDSHFFIPFEIGSRPGVMNGWLQPGDKVELTFEESEKRGREDAPQPSNRAKE